MFHTLVELDVANDKNTRLALICNIGVTFDILGISVT